MTFGPLPLDSVAGSFLLAFPALFSIVNPIGSAMEVARRPSQPHRASAC